MIRTLTRTLPVAVAILASWSCGSSSTAPLSPSTQAPPAIVADTPPKISTPSPQSPVDDQRIVGLSATLTAGAASVEGTSVTPQYRFQLFNDHDALVQDSGLQGAPSWATTLTLTPNQRFTWKVRAEYQGVAGPWSSSASFRTPDPPPAYAGPIGDWQSCGSIAKKLDLVICVWNAIKPENSVGDFEVSKRVAWLLRGEGAGLLIKNSGENIVLWQGYSFSASRVCYPDGHIYKLMLDSGPGGSNAPQFADNDFVDPSLYVPAIDPSKP